MTQPPPVPTSSLEYDFRRLVETYTRPAKAQRLKVVLDVLQFVAVLIAVLAFMLSLPQSQAWLRQRLKNDDLLPLERSQLKDPVASSYIDPSMDTSTKLTYAPGNVLDDDPTASWQECGGADAASTRSSADAPGADCEVSSNPESEGKGEWIELRIVRPTAIHGVRIRNGYQRNYDLYRLNPRIKKLQIDALGLNGNKVFSWQENLRDDFTQGYQYIEFSDTDATEPVSALRLTILSSYPSQQVGSRMPFQDTSISDVQVVPWLVAGTAP